MTNTLAADRGFLRRMLSVMAPVLVQNVITNFVNLLDNLMVGQVGTEPMSGVAIVNQLMFVFNLLMFGCVAGPGIFTAQFYGKRDFEGVRRTVRMKLYVALAGTVLFLAVLLWKGNALISLYLHEGGEGLDLAATLSYARSYLMVMLFQLLPFALSQVIAGTLRECGETVLPMRAGLAAVVVNFVFNYVLIFGKLGAPALGVTGAAVATVLSRVTETLIYVFWVRRRQDRVPYMKGLLRSFGIPKELARKIAVMGTPLLANEFLWALGMTSLNQCYSTRGLDVVAAVNIASTVYNLFCCAVFSLGTTVSILVGQRLGAGELEEAVRDARRTILYSAALCAGIGIVMLPLAPLIPRLYNTTDDVRAIAAKMLCVCACHLPFHAFMNACYFTLRSGGKTILTFAFDSGFAWLVSYPVAFVLSRFTTVEILPMYITVMSLDVLKCVLGVIFFERKTWVKNLVG